MKSIFLFVIMSIIAMNLAAQETFDLSNDRAFKLGAGFVSRQLEDDSDKIDSTGFVLSAGLIFPLDASFSTDTTIQLSYLSLDHDDANIDSYMADLALTQRLAYNWTFSTLIFRPYLEVGIGYGDYHTDMNILVGADRIDADMDVYYLKYGASLGGELIFANGLSLFAQYDFYKYDFDKEVKVEANNNGVIVNQTVDLEGDSKIDGKGFSLGLSYLF